MDMEEDMDIGLDMEDDCMDMEDDKTKETS